jgi:glycosyltransferase involved in cell wall biosynthesis/SAM-dependent methyltransferase
MTKVSIIIPTYNRNHFLCEAINSVLNQTFKDYEIIVVDDGSTDNTREVLERYGSRIQYIYQKNSGRAQARNAGIRMAKAEYIAFLDDDDIWLPNKLEKQIAFLDAHPDIGLVHSFTEVINENGYLLIKETKNHLKFYKKAMCLGYTYEALSRMCMMFTSTVVVRKDCLDEAELFDPDIPAFEDWDFYLRFVLKYCIGTIPESLVMYREHEKRTPVKSFIEGRIKTSLKHLELIKSSDNFSCQDKIKYNFFVHLARTHYMLFDFTQFRKYALQALKIMPFALFHTPLVSYLLIMLLPSSLIRRVRLLKQSKAISSNHPERIIPKKTYGGSLAIHLKRYDFARQFCQGKIVLDAACGVGYGSSYLASVAKEIIGVDISEKAISYAKEHYQRDNIQFKVMDIHNLGFPDKYFDIVCSFETLEHLDNLERFISKVKHLLKDDGIFIVSTPQVKSMNYSPENPYHKVEFSYKGLGDLLRKYFVKVEIFGQRRLQSVFHYYLQKIDILHFRALLSVSLRHRICHTLATKAWDEMDLQNFVISKNNINRAIVLIGICRKKDNL